MATRVSPELESAEWARLRHHEEQTGEIPLPAVDRIQFFEDRSPTIVLVAPEVVPGATHVFVDVENMQGADMLELHALLDELKREVAAKRQLIAILHLGGFDYRFDRVKPSRTVSLRELPVARQINVWGILRAIARVGAESPDIPASTVVEVPFP
jgi:hypothetical protein